MRPPHATAVGRTSSACLAVVLAAALGLWTAPAAAVQETATWKADPALGNWNTAANWEGGVVPNNAGGTTYAVLVDGGKGAVDSTVNVDAHVTIDTLTVDTGDTVAINGSRSLTLAGGTLANAGTVALNATSAITSLKIATDVALSGGGIVELSNSPWNRIQGVAGTERLTNLDNTLRGSGLLGPNLLALTNQGLIEANQSIALTLDPNAGGVTNTGILQANGGTLVLTDGTFTNTGGTIRALDGSNVDLENGTQIVGGTLTTAGTGQVRSVGAGVVLEDLTSAGQCVIANSSSTALRGTIQNTGALAMAAAGSVTYLYAATDTVTLTGGGTVTLSNSIFNYVRGTVGTERLINQDNAIRGSGHLGLNLLALTNQGLIEANQSIALALDPNAGGVLNEGTLRASGAGGLSLTAGTFTNTGTVEAAGGNVTFTASAAITNYNAGALTLTGGAWKALAGSTLSFAGDPAIAVNAADVTLSGPGSAFGSIDSLAANAAAGQFHVLGGRTFTTLAGLSNAGRVDVGTGSTLAVTGDYTQTGGLTAVNGLLTATGTIGIQAGTLAGAGTVTGAAVLGGTLSPGNSIDTLTFSALTVQGNAVYDFQISGAASDRADVTGAGGAFRIDPAGDYTVNVTILGFAGALGPHDMFTWVGDDPLTPHEWGALQYTANFQPGVTGQWLYLPDENRMVLNILTVPEPATLALMGLGLAALLRRRRAA